MKSAYGCMCDQYTVQCAVKLLYSEIKRIFTYKQFTFIETEKEKNERYKG